MTSMSPAWNRITAASSVGTIRNAGNFVKVGETISGCVLVQSWPFTVRRLTPRIRCLVDVDAAVTQLRRDVLGVCHGLRRALIQIRVYATKQHHCAGHEGGTERCTPPRGVSSERRSRDDTFSWGSHPNRRLALV